MRNPGRQRGAFSERMGPTDMRRRYMAAEYRESVTTERQKPEFRRVRNRSYREWVRSGLNTQRSVYRKHLEMQRAFLDTGNKIRSGANLFENSQFEQAKKEFKVLKQVAMIEIPSNLIPYLVGSHSMKLEDYNSVFEKYQPAAADLIASCGEEKERVVRNQEFDAGLKKFLQAREIFAIQ